MLNIQTDTRGNLMAHDKSYLHPFIEANNKIKDIFKTLKVLVRDNPVQVWKTDMTFVQAGKQAMNEIRGIITHF